MYLVNPGAGTVAGFGVDRSTGALTPLASSPTTPSGRPVALAIDARARFAYVGMRNAADALVTYAIDGWTGALSAVPCSGLAAPPITAELNGGFPQTSERLSLVSIALHPSGRFAFVTYNYSCNECICGVEAWLYVYAVDPATGVLTKLNHPPVDLGRAGRGDSPPDGVSAVSAMSGAYLYTASRGVTRGGAEACDEESLLRGFAGDSGTGRLRALTDWAFAHGSPNDGEGHRWLLLAPSGDFLYLARQQDTVQFKVKTNGELIERGTSPRAGPAAFSPSGRLYSATRLDSEDGVEVFDVQADTRSLVPRPGSLAPTPGAVSALAIDASGRFLYAVQTQAGVLSAFTIDAETGLLQEAPGSPTIVGAEPASSDFRIVAIASVP